MVIAMKSATLADVIPSQGGGSVTAVTSLDDDVVFVARSYSQRVDVYDAATLTLRGRLTVPGLGLCPSGLAACPQNNCLYAADHLPDRVHRVDLSGSNAVKKWSVASGPRGLSVNSERNLIVACCYANKLQEYTTHGSLVREICLQAGLTSPWHAIQLSTGDYVVSQCKSRGMVSVVGPDGQVVRSYGQSQTSECPCVAAVTKNDNILVADANNHRIVSFHSWGLTQVLAAGIYWPMVLCLDESRGRIYAGNRDGEVFVYDEVRL